MSLYVVSSDWRFKEKFKSHFTPAFLKEFSMAEKVLVSLQTEQPDLLVIDNRLSKASYDWFLQVLSERKAAFPILLCLENDQQVSDQYSRQLRLHIAMRKNIDYEKLFARLDSLKTNEEVQEKRSFHPSRLIGDSDCMHQLRKQLKQFANQECSIHLYGETGTGKEIAANYLHQMKFPNRKIVPVNCSLLNGSLGNAMFFGHSKGAFTDGKAELPGLIYEADQSTLFLDEVENLSLEFQSHLLRLLETGNYRRYGDTRMHTSKFRLVSASNVRLSDLSHRNVMRKDFLYRITDVQIHLPALRDHLEDISQLCKHYFNLNAPTKELSDESLDVLMAYHWPGNVRQLFSTLKRSIIKSGDQQIIQVKQEDISLA